MRVLPLNRGAALVELTDLAAVRALHAAVLVRPIEGVYSWVPAARTLLAEFDPWQLDAAQLAAALRRRFRTAAPPAPGGWVELPVRYDGEDLEAVADHLGITPAALIARHTAQAWTVAFTGFAPGFAYLSADGADWAIPRRASPRTRMPAGAVALAGPYSGIYPRESPGGWQWIGHTDVPMWQLDRDPPALLQPGQRVRFVDVATEAGARLQAALGQAQRMQVPVRATPAPVPALQVEATGLQALFQDGGRRGQAGQGVSASGALDRGALHEANAAVGNAPEAAVIELLGGGFTLRALQPVVLAVAGAGGALTRVSDHGVRPLSHGGPHGLDPGERLIVGPPRCGLRRYLAVRGGFEAPAVLGSRARDTLAGLGPEPIKNGQYLLVSDMKTTKSVGYPIEFSKNLPVAGDTVTLDMHWGPRADWFTREAQAQLTEQAWTVTPQSNRVGLRLSAGVPLTRTAQWQGVELASEGMVAGALQVPPEGQPVLFLADHPVTGGYPVIACVAPHHLDLAAQLPAGVHVRFRPVPIAASWSGGQGALAA